MIILDCQTQLLGFPVIKESRMVLVFMIELF